MPLPVCPLGQAVPPERNGTGAGIFDSDRQIAVFVRRYADPDPFFVLLRVVAAGIDGVFHPVGKNHAKVGLVNRAFLRDLRPDRHPAALLPGPPDIGAQHGVYGCVFAPGLLFQLGQLTVKRADVLQPLGRVCPVEQPLQHPQVVAHIVAVLPPLLGFPAQVLIFPALGLQLQLRGLLGLPQPVQGCGRGQRPDHHADDRERRQENQQQHRVGHRVGPIRRTAGTA